MTIGVCFGKFTKTMKFKMHVTCLDYLAHFAKVYIFTIITLLLDTITI